MISRPKLYFPRLIRLAVLCSLPAVVATAHSQTTSPNPDNVIPNVGGRPELLTVFDMRQDQDPADRVFAKSAQGLMNAEPQRTDKIYLVFNDQDQKWLDWLLKRQYVLSSGTMHDMEELVRRWPNRDAILCDDAAPHISAAVAACERLLLVTKQDLVSKYHLTVRKDVRGQWKSDSDGQIWLFDHYGSQLNKRIVDMSSNGTHQTDLLDYEIANKVFSFSLSPDAGDDQTLDILTNKFAPNIPCLAVGDRHVQSQVEAINRAAKFVIPAGGLSNLSVWTTFRAYTPGASEQDSSAVDYPRDLYQDLSSLTAGNWLTSDSRQAKMRMPWLRELAPPLYESFVRARNGKIDVDRDSFQMGVANESVYGAAYGSIQAQIWSDYRRLSRRALELAARN
jgi:hypothetical protein